MLHYPRLGSDFARELEAERAYFHVPCCTTTRPHSPVSSADDLSLKSRDHHQLVKSQCDTLSKLVTTICIDFVIPLPLSPSSLSAVAIAAFSISGVNAPSCVRTARRTVSSSAVCETYAMPYGTSTV